MGIDVSVTHAEKKERALNHPSAVGRRRGRRQDRLFGNNIRFAIETISAMLRSGHRESPSARRPIFGNQIRFTVRTIRAGIERRRRSRR